MMDFFTRYISDGFESSVDIDYLEDFIFAESILKSRAYE